MLRQLQAVFGLPIPDGFLLASWNPTDDEAAAIARYLDVVPELFNSGALAGNYGFEYKFDADGASHVTAHAPARQELRALAALFQQFHNPQEKASFKAVYKIVSRQEHSDSGDYPRRPQQLRVWTRAADRLGREWLEYLFAETAG